MSETLIIAVPSKGRLEENTAAYFANAGLPLKRPDARGYSGRMEGLDNVEIAYLSASEIAARLKDGSVHFGVTGEDLLREEISDLENYVQLVLPLGFGRADVVVAVPDGWVDVTHMADLAEVAVDFRGENNRPMRVATKYRNLANDFLIQNGLHGIRGVQIIPSFGATENAPNSGAAELIVDITSTGATLAANNLRVPEDGVILQSQAQLAASLKADWSESVLQAAKKVLVYLEAKWEAERIVKVEFVVSKGDRIGQSDSYLVNRLNIIDEYGVRFTNAEIDSDTYKKSNSFFILEENIQPFINEWMEVIGNEDVIITKPDFVFNVRNTLYEKLITALRPQ